MNKSSQNQIRSHKNIVQSIQGLNFPIEMCFAIENVWVTSLMISFDTPNIVDSLIWIIPNILSILFRPYLTVFVLHNDKIQKKSRKTQLIMIYLMMSLGIFGCFVISISVWMQVEALRIFICTVGWTLMDFGFEMVQYYSEKYQQNYQKIQKPMLNQQAQSSQDYDIKQMNYDLKGTITGYVLSIIICFLFKDKKMKKFQQNASLSYLLCALLALFFLYSFYKSIKNHIKNQSFKKLLLFRSPICYDPGYYLPGYYQFTMAPKYDKILLFYHFTVLYIVDTVLIYATMWYAYLYENDGYKIGMAYNYGMGHGALLLIIYTLFKYLDLGFQKNISNSLEKVLQVYLVTVAISSMLCYIWKNHYIYASLFVIVGITHSFYQNHFQPQIIKKHPVYEACLQYVDRIEKIFILFPMPFIVMIILDRDDIEQCLIAVFIIILIALFAYSLILIDFQKKKRAKKANKIQ